MTEEEQQQPLLTVDHLEVRFTKRFGFVKKQTSVVEAVKDVSFSLGRSEMVSIVGESGCGKTTLANCVLGLITPSSGSIYYMGNDLARIRGKNLKQYRRDVQIIFQDPYGSLNPRQRVRDAISAPLRYLLKQKDPSKIRETVATLMNEVGLEPSRFAERFPHQLSGGERQRVNIARALATNPKILVADEPTTMLDATQRFAVLRLLRELSSKRNLTILLITHDLATARVLGGKIFVMYLGRKVEEGPSREVLTVPHHPYVELILESTPRLKRSILLSGESSEVPVSTLDETLAINRGCVFRPRCKYSTSICGENEPRLAEISSSRLVACYNPLNREVKEQGSTR